MTPLMGYAILTAGLLSVSIPIIIHLLHRQKTTPLLWGAMLFLKQSPLQMKRRKQVDHWLLMVLRMLVLAFLAYLVAQPKFKATADPLGQKSVDVAVVIDHSLSMGRRTGTRTLFEEAQQVADQLARGTGRILHDSDTMTVVLAEHQPRKLTPRPYPVRDSGLIEALHDQIHALKPGTTDCTIPEAIAAAREVLSHGTNPRKIVLVVSDEQRSNWVLEGHDSKAVWDLAMGEDTASSHRLEVHSYPLTPDETGSNITIGSISMQPSVAGIDRPASFSATVSNSGPQAVPHIKLHFSVNDGAGNPHLITSTEIDKLEAKQTATVRFEHVFTKPPAAANPSKPQPQSDAVAPDSHWVTISTDVVDALAADNQSVFAVNVWKTLPVLVIGVPPKTDAEKEARMNLEIAMRPDDKAMIQPEFIDVASSATAVLDKYFAVVLNDVPRIPANLQENLGNYVNSGRGLWVILGSHSGGLVKSLGDTYQNVSLLSAEQSEKPYERPRAASADEASNTITVKDETNPIVTAFKQVDRSPLATRNTVTTKWWSLKRRDSSTQVVLESSNGDPLVLERQLGSGRVVVWTTSVDGTWNTWQGSQDFLPLVHETLFHLFPQACTSVKENITAGQSFTWSGPSIESQPNLEVNVIPPEGPAEPRQAHARDGRYEFDYQNAFLPGTYRLTFPTAPKTPQPVYYGVGINPRELETTRLSTDDIASLTKDKYLDEKAPRVDAGQLEFVITRVSEAGTDWWKYLALLVVLSLCLETFMTYRMAGLQKNVDTATAGLVRGPAVA